MAERENRPGVAISDHEKAILAAVVNGGHGHTDVPAVLRVGGLQYAREKPRGQPTHRRIHSALFRAIRAVCAGRWPVSGHAWIWIVRICAGTAAC